MTDRYRGGYAPTGRPVSSNAPRSPIPTSVGYSSTYAGDMHVMPTSTRPPATTTPRGYSTSTNASGLPTTTRTYAVNNDGRSRSSARDNSRTRRSTLDSTVRPPVIITTTQNAQKDRDGSYGPSSRSVNPRSGSPPRDAHRSGDYYTQSASTARSRSAARPYHVHSASEDHGRARDRNSLLSPVDVDAYRSSRPSVVYPSDPRHSTAAIDYGDEGYQYTNAGDLVRYDLDQNKPRSRRPESFDRGYYRPNINYNADQRRLDVNTSHDLNRSYTLNTPRPYEGRGGPPPSTRGFDKISRPYDSSRDALPSVPALPAPTAPKTSTQIEVAGPAADRRDSRGPRPTSLYLDGPPRSSHYDDYYRSRDDERNMRDYRDRDRDSTTPVTSHFHDTSVPSRGFGIRTELLDGYEDHRDRRYETRKEEPRRDDPRWDEPRREEVRREELRREEPRREEPRREEPRREEPRREEPRREEPRREEPRREEPRREDPRKEELRREEPRREEPRREEPRREEPRREEPRREEPRREEPRKRSDEDLARGSDLEREERNRRLTIEDRRERRDSRRDDDDNDKEDRSHLHEKLAAGAGLAATAVGLAASGKSNVKVDDDKSTRPPQRNPDGDRKPERRDESVGHYRASEPSKAPEPSREREREEPRERPSREPDAGVPVRSRRDIDSRADGEVAVVSASNSEDEGKRPRRHRPSTAFNPNDASDLRQLKEQIAAMDSEKGRDRTERERPGRERGERDLERPVPSRRERTRSSSPAKENTAPPSPSDDSRGRELVLPGTEGKQVRVVSPPRDNKDDRPLKGILKQPKSSFPEEHNPTREGVAPHKEDKKLKEAPAGARWTKINRKIVNPEALSIGKERFEVRDDFVIVLRVLSKEEIQAYAAATQVLRERRKKKTSVEGDDERDDEGSRRHHRHRRHRDDDEGGSDVPERDHDRRRRHRRDGDGDYDSLSKDSENHHHHHRSHRDRDRDRTTDV